MIGLRRPRKTLEGSIFGPSREESSGNIVNEMKGILIYFLC